MFETKSIKSTQLKSELETQGVRQTQISNCHNLQMSLPNSAPFMQKVKLLLLLIVKPELIRKTFNLLFLTGDL